MFQQLPAPGIQLYHGSAILWWHGDPLHDDARETSRATIRCSIRFILTSVVIPRRRGAGRQHDVPSFCLLYILLLPTVKSVIIVDLRSEALNTSPW
jgi:hypothetical protein